jgi:3-deoxy-7-phosphoheptulonate synthase
LIQTGFLGVTESIHERCGSHVGGVHIELTGENVCECVGGARHLTEADLNRGYRSLVDPRLNYEQAIETALFIARKMRSVNGLSAHV